MHLCIAFLSTPWFYMSAGLKYLYLVERVWCYYNWPQSAYSSSDLINLREQIWPFAVYAVMSQGCLSLTDKRTYVETLLKFFVSFTNKTLKPPASESKSFHWVINLDRPIMICKCIHVCDWLISALGCILMSDWPTESFAVSPIQTTFSKPDNAAQFWNSTAH